MIVCVYTCICVCELIVVCASVLHMLECVWVTVYVCANIHLWAHAKYMCVTISVRGCVLWLEYVGTYIILCISAHVLFCWGHVSMYVHLYVFFVCACVIVFSVW